MDSQTTLSFTPFISNHVPLCYFFFSNKRSHTNRQPIVLIDTNFDEKYALVKNLNKNNSLLVRPEVELKMANMDSDVTISPTQNQILLIQL